MSIAVLGEAIADLIPKKSMTYEAVIGGSPFNFARAVRKVVDHTFYLSPISIDGFGDEIVAAAQASGVQYNTANRSEFPSSLAVVKYVDDQPSYALYRQGVADVMFDAALLDHYLPEDCRVFHTGSLMLVPEVIDEVALFIKQLKAKGIAVTLDLNLRPNVTKDTQAYVDKIMALIPFADVIKASDEDLEFFAMDLDANPELVAEYFSHCILVYTKGSAGSVAYFKGQAVSVKAMQVTKFVDTIGAGDTFFGFFVGTLLSVAEQATAWYDLDLITAALERAATAAAMNVERKGCQPPELKDVEVRLAANKHLLKY